MNYQCDVDRFNNFYSGYYKKLLAWSKRHKIPEDTLHDSYILIHDRIARVGFTGNSFITYVKLSAKNLHINNSKKSSKVHFIDVFDEDWVNTIEDVLTELDNDNTNRLIYQDELLFFSKMLFKFIDYKGYDEEWKFVFKTYFLMSGRMTYLKLTEMTDVNKNKCTKIITQMKADIKSELLNWIKENKLLEV